MNTKTYSHSGTKFVSDNHTAAGDRPIETAQKELGESEETHGWPRHWRPYSVLLSGFMMMFNCWSVGHLGTRSLSLTDA